MRASLVGRGVVALLLAMAFLGLTLSRDSGAQEPDTEPEEKMVEEPVGDVLPMLNVGGHTGPISDLAFDPNGWRRERTQSRKSWWCAGRFGERSRVRIATALIDLFSM